MRHSSQLQANGLRERIGKVWLLDGVENKLDAFEMGREGLDNGMG
jgi:hypothetical protein